VRAGAFLEDRTEAMFLEHFDGRLGERW
jgi:hypothetical protein